jgi:acyl carrier protein
VGGTVFRDAETAPGELSISQQATSEMSDRRAGHNRGPEAIARAVSDTLCRVCDRPAVALPADLPLADVPNIDSLRLLQAIALLEETFSVEIDVVTLERLDRVCDIVEIISDALPEE